MLSRPNEQTGHTALAEQVVVTDFASDSAVASVMDVFGQFLRGAAHPLATGYAAISHST